MILHNIDNYKQLEEYKALFSDILDHYEINCLCGKQLDSSDLAFYQYPKSESYWLYAHCSYCNYDLNYQKIYRKYEQQKKNKDTKLSYENDEYTF